MEAYRNNQTMSTKCQYQAAASNPVEWVEIISKAFIRRKQI
jgi:hypothetical protein